VNGVGPVDATVNVSGTGHLRVADGQITELHETADTLNLLVQLTPIPPAPDERRSHEEIGRVDGRLTETQSQVGARLEQLASRIAALEQKQQDTQPLPPDVSARLDELLRRVTALEQAHGAPSETPPAADVRLDRSSPP